MIDLFWLTFFKWTFLLFFFSPWKLDFEIPPMVLQKWISILCGLIFLYVLLCLEPLCCHLLFLRKHLIYTFILITQGSFLVFLAPKKENKTKQKQRRNKSNRRDFFVCVCVWLSTGWVSRGGVNKSLNTLQGMYVAEVKCNASMLTMSWMCAAWEIHWADLFHLLQKTQLDLQR